MWPLCAWAWSITPVTRNSVETDAFLDFLHDTISLDKIGSYPWKSTCRRGGVRVVSSWQRNGALNGPEQYLIRLVGLASHMSDFFPDPDLEPSAVCECLPGAVHWFRCGFHRAFSFPASAWTAFLEKVRWNMDEKVSHSQEGAALIFLAKYRLADCMAIEMSGQVTPLLRIGGVDCFAQSSVLYETTHWPGEWDRPVILNILILAKALRDFLFSRLRLYWGLQITMLSSVLSVIRGCLNQEEKNSSPSPVMYSENTGPFQLVSAQNAMS